MILDRILEHKKAELRGKQSQGYLAELKCRIADRPAPLGFIQTVESQATPQAPALIAEVKKSSPSQGLMRQEFADAFNPVEIANIYKMHGAAAVSVLTDTSFFQGALAYLEAIKQTVGLPALNKEFMVGDIQFYEARAFGADAVLLIVAALDRIQLEDFFAVATGLDMDVLLETHHEREVETVLERIPSARLIGINNRDLQTFSTDLVMTERLAARIPEDRLIVSESGIHTREDVQRVMAAGAKAMLIGESLIRANNIGEKIIELLGPPQETPEEAEENAHDRGRWI